MTNGDSHDSRYVKKQHHLLITNRKHAIAIMIHPQQLF